MGLVVDYTSLKTDIADTLARSDLTSAIPGFIQKWEEKFLRQPRNFGRWMEAELSGTIASSVLAVPADYLGLKVAYINSSPATPPLGRVSLTQLYGRYPRNGGTDVPGLIARDRTNFVFGPAPDSEYEVLGTYWAKPTVIRSAPADAAEHWIIVNAPDLAVYGALLQSAPYLQNDKRLGTWQALYNDALQDYRDLHQDEDVSGGALREVLA